MLKLGFKELWTDLDFEGQYPIEQFAATIPQVIGTSRDIIHFDFSGIDKLSDEVFYVLKQEMKLPQKQNVESINLTGCCFITDRGIEILAQSFFNLKELILVGCSQITQMSLQFLMENCPKLEKLLAQFTKISFVSNAFESRWGRESIICNELFRENENNEALSINLVILAMDNTITCDIGHYLATGNIKNRPMDEPIIFQPNAFSINDISINIIQLFCPTVYMAPFIYDRSLFVIAIDIESDTSNAFNIIKGLDFIRGMVYSCPIQIMVFTTTPETDKLDELSKVLQSIFVDQQVNMKEHLDQEHYSKSFDKSYIDQWRYVQSLSSVDPDHISLHLLGLNRINPECDMCYCATICEASTSGKIEEITTEFYNTYLNVKDAIDRINKSDIAETKSFSSFPEGLAKIIECLIQLFKKKVTVQEFVNDPLLLTPLRDYKVLTDDENPEESLRILKMFFGSKEKLDKSSRGIKLSTAFGLWLLAKWDLCEKLAPLKNKLWEFELLSKTRQDAKKTYDLVLINLRQNLVQLTKYMYPFLPLRSTKAMSLVTDFINKQETSIITVQYVDKEIKELTKSDISLTLDLIQSTGRIIWLSSLDLIIINLKWFINTINLLLTNWNAPINNDRVWFVTSQAVISSRDELFDVVSEMCDHEMFEKLLNILNHYGLMLNLTRSWNVEPQNWEPVIFSKDKMLYMGFNQLSLKPDSNIHLVVKNPNLQVKGSLRVLHTIFPQYNSVEYMHDDISFKFSFKFRVGIPCNLFCQVVRKLVMYFRTVLLWNQGLLIREGAAEVLILHNIHASRGSSSFDMEARILGPVNDRRPVAIREHMWSFLSQIITIIEAQTVEYRHLHHKLRYYCVGQCYKEFGQENTFSKVQVSRCLNCNYYCTKCRDYQMSRADWLYMMGRQLILPNHDFDKGAQKSCKSCWTHKPLLDLVWESQKKVFPTFGSKAFYSKENKCIKGNIIMTGSSESSVRSRVKCMKRYFKYTEFLVLDPTFTKIILFQKTTSTENELFSWDLETGEISTNLKDDDIFKVSHESPTKHPIMAGNIIEFRFLTDIKEDHVMEITVENVLIKRYFLNPQSTDYLSVKVVPEKDESEKMKIIIQSADVGLVSSLHFRPGMIVLLKGETKWEPAIIFEIKNGKLNCQPLSSFDTTAAVIRPVQNQFISLNSTAILPPASYPSEINSTLDSKNQKSQADNWYKILSEYSEYMAAPFGLFPRLVDKVSYIPLPILGDESRECTSSPFSPTKILKLMFFNKPLSNRTLTSYLPLPHPLTPVRLLMPQRQVIGHDQNHALHRLCPGSLWRNYIRDMHPLNEKPYEMKEGEASFFFHGEYILDSFIVIKNFTTSYSAVYQNIEQCFPFIDPEINRNLLRDAIISIVKVYRDILLLDIVSKIKIYSNNILSMESTVESLVPTNFINKKKFSKRSRMPSVIKLDQDLFKSSPWSQEDIEIIQNLLKKKFIGCESHKLASKVMEIPDLGPYCQCIANIMLKNTEIENIQETALISCTKLRKLEIDYGKMLNISWIVLLPQLTALTLSNCGLQEIGSEISHVQHSLKQLCLNGNPIREIPEIICEFTNLNSLELNNTLITRLPDNIGNLQFLKYFSIEHTKLSFLPESFSQLQNLATLKISGVASGAIFNKKKSISPKEWTDFCLKTSEYGFVLMEEEILNSFEDFTDTDGNLPQSKFDEFSLFLFENIPRFKEFPPQILTCTSIQSLIISNHAFGYIPDDIKNLTHLKRIVLDNCRNLQTLSSYVGTLPLEVLSCQNCDNLRTPPYEIRRQGMRNTIAYLLRLVSGSEACYRTKLMLVGLGGAGKTSLMRALMNKNFVAPQIAEEAITDGIDISSWSSKESGDITLQFSIWDFAGQTLYYNTHQFFLTKRSVYLLLWNIRQGFEHAGLDFWLNSITCHAPSAPIFIVGTHSDKVDKSEIPYTHFLSRYPSIVGFFFVSSLTGKGIKELHDKILEETKKQPYIGEIVPNAWLRFEKELISQRSTANYLHWDSVKSLAINNAIYDGEIHQAVRFLHDLGSIQYFEFPLLKDFVIINSQWLVDVMACVVSVKNTIIENGKLEHSNVKLVWSKYPESIHNWLLRLTEIFDLTFSVPDQTFNIIPCLLPNDRPDFQWSDFVDFTQTREANMFYEFEYLPPGLFNRAQVRLSQFSDSFVIWQNGSLLNKNNDKALMTKLNDTTVKICARGVWPENILFIIHEMFENLINEAFSGVKYEYQMSCKKCVAERDSEPYLFTKHVLQRALQSKTMFIQCHRNFHIITMNEIQESTPPDSIEDYDIQFKKSIHFISSNIQQTTNVIMMLVSEEDYQNNTELLNTSKRILKDLNKSQYSVWCEPLIDGSPEDKYIETLTNAQAVISVISGNFTVNKLCMKLFKFAKTTLRKDIILVLIDKKYQDDSLGLETAGDKYINFERSDVYDKKFNELLSDIKTRIQGDNVQVSDVPKPRVFISYCWHNSQRSFNSGNSKIANKNALGWGDPRDIKDYIEQNGYACWLDVEMIGSSLYSDITSGLRHSEIVVACLSTEYAQSDICKKEFMFARQNLNLPIVIAEVGCSQDWIKTEIGLLSIEYPKVLFQTPNPGAFEEIVNIIRSKLPPVRPVTPPAESNSAKMNKVASQEDFELIQRKIFRLLTSGFGSEESRLYPRLFFIDIADETNLIEQFSDSNYLSIISSNIPKIPLCFKTLCESETGWHTIDNGIFIDLNASEQERLLILCAPYLYRITLLLKFSEGRNIELFSSTTNQDFSKYIMNTLETNSKSWSYMKPIHNAIRSHIMSRDINLNYGGLQSCCLNNGKVVWLCPEHSSRSYVSVIGSEESGSLIKLERKRTNTEKDYMNQSEFYNSSELMKDNVLIEKLTDLMKEQFSDSDSSADNQKVSTETNKFLQMVGTSVAPRNKSSISPPQSFHSVVPGRKMIPPLEINKHSSSFQSKTCLMM